MWVGSAQAAESGFGDVNPLLGQKQCLKPPCKAGSVPIYTLRREFKELSSILLEKPLNY